MFTLSTLFTRAMRAVSGMRRFGAQVLGAAASSSLNQIERPTPSFADLYCSDCVAGSLGKRTHIGRGNWQRADREPILLGGVNL